MEMEMEMTVVDGWLGVAVRAGVREPKYTLGP